MGEHTPGPWKAEKVAGWGGGICITAPSRDGDNERPLLKLNRPHTYYTDYPKYEDENGETWIKCSTDAAREAGNYIATKEIREEIEKREKADAHLIASAPDLLEALEEMLEDYADAALEWDTENKWTALKITRKAEAAIAKAHGED